jgi:hypothetical protein
MIDLGVAYMNIGIDSPSDSNRDFQFAKAEEYFEKGLRINPTNGHGYFQYSLLKLAQGNDTGYVFL